MQTVGIIGLGWLGEALAFRLDPNLYTIWGTYRSKKPDFSPAYQINQKLLAADIIVFCFPPNRTKNEQFSLELVELIQGFGSATRFILVSSTSVYASSNNTCSEDDENVIYERENPNLLAENELKSRLQNRLTIVRMAGLVGGKRYPIRFMSESGKSYTGKDPVNVIHQEDAVGLLQYVIEKDIFGETINGCSSEHPSKKEYFSWMANELKIIPPDFLDSFETLKIVSNHKSLQMGYNYRFTSPYDFPIVL